MVFTIWLLQYESKGGQESVSKQDYNFQTLLLVIAIMLGIVGVGALAALVMFLTLIT